MAVCRLVHGIPLGILLAAAWSRVLTPAEIAAEIGRDLGFLQTDMADVPTRQRNLRAVFLHTWSRLSAAARQAFMRLSVFRGGASAEAVRQVTGATVGALAELTDMALLRHLSNGRYAVHELLRQFAQEQLEQDQQAALAVRDAHSAVLQSLSGRKGNSHQLRGAAPRDSGGWRRTGQYSRCMGLGSRAAAQPLAQKCGFHLDSVLRLAGPLP